MTKLDFLLEEFDRIHGGAPEHVVRAPGRVNLIGEHTDYNDGFVMPIAIDRSVLMAARRRSDGQFAVTALDILGGQTDIFPVENIVHHPDYRWANYIRGVAYMLRERGCAFPGLDLVITSEIPPGAGLSSSAALEVCTAVMLQTFGGFLLERVEMARLCQRAETDFVGVNTGIMDQYASALGESDAALMIDCRALSYLPVKLPPGVTVVVADTMKKRHLAGSNYNIRRSECENAALLIGQLLGKPIAALRDVSVSDLRATENELPPTLAARARHVITENERVARAAHAARRGDAPAFGKLMQESQRSLREDYDASSPELDLMVEIASGQPGCLGSRLTGAGWGGATVNLVVTDMVEAFVANVVRAYHDRTGIEAWVSPVRAARGASVLAPVPAGAGNPAK